MNKKGLVSVIIPAYNAEIYIEQCLRSIMKQSYSDIEIIVVIDGSKDKSEEIAHMLATEDKRIDVLWQENAGSGPARNRGLTKANGEYVMFVDPDDWIESNMIADLVEVMNAEHSDLVTSGCVTDIYKNGKLVNSIEESFLEEKICGKQNVRNAYLRLFNMGALSAPTKKIYRKEIIDKCKVVFPDLRRSQDIVFNYRYYDCIESVTVYSKAYYHYRVDEAENIKKIPPTYYKNIDFIYNDVISLLQNWGLNQESNDFHEYCNHFLFSTIALLRTLDTVSEVEMVISNSSIRSIVKNARPSGAKKKIISFLIMIRASWLIKLIVSVCK